MRSFGIRILIIFTVFCLAFPMLAVNAVGDAVEVKLSFGGEAYRGSDITLTVTVEKPTVALAGLEFTLAYDTQYVKAKITENSENLLQMDALVASKPNGWEQISHHKEGLYTFRFAMPDNGKDALDNASELVLKIPHVFLSTSKISAILLDIVEFLFNCSIKIFEHFLTNSISFILSGTIALKITDKFIVSP